MENMRPATWQRQSWRACCQVHTITCLQLQWTHLLHFMLKKRWNWNLPRTYCLTMGWLMYSWSEQCRDRYTRSEFDAGKQRISCFDAHAACCFHPSKQATSQYLVSTMSSSCLLRDMVINQESPLIFDFLKLCRLCTVLVLHERITQRPMQRRALRKFRPNVRIPIGQSHPTDPAAQRPNPSPIAEKSKRPTKFVSIWSTRLHWL